MKGSRGTKHFLLGWATLAAVAALAPPVMADQVFHSAHLDLTAVGSAPLRSGFVEDIKANGPQIYAHEIFALNGATPNADYQVTRNFFPQDPQCRGDVAFHDEVATLATNAAGNAHEDVFITPEQITPGSEGVHGVSWTVRDANGAVVYRTDCIAVTLD